MTLRRLPALMDAAAKDLLEAEFRQVPLPVDVTNPRAFPNIAAARRHVAAMTPERRAQVGDWS